MDGEPDASTCSRTGETVKRSEFEEKEYESPLYRELLWGNHRIASPGQVFEGAFGIDCAMEAHDPNFWAIFGYPDIPDGVFLNNYSWGWVFRRYGKSRQLPNFPVNLLIQAKAPDYMSGPNAKFVTRGIPKSYWRIEAKEHQQSLLELLAKKLNNRALIVYAGPAFHTHGDLYDYTEKQTIVNRSSFIKVERMATHHAWNYDKAGCRGIASSTPEPVDDGTFDSLLASALEQAPRESSALDDLKQLSAAIVEVAEESPDNPIAQYFMRHLGEIPPRLTGRYRQQTSSFVTAQAFFRLTNVGWLVAGHAVA
jgi:hypothetical protein